MKSPHLPLSYSRMSRFKKSPLLFLVRSPYSKTPAQVLGSAAHCRILEGPDVFDSRYTLAPVNEKTGKEYGASSAAYAKHAEEAGREVISAASFDIVHCMAESVESHESASRILSGGKAESHVFGTVSGIEAHGYIDYSGERHIAELKTCADLDKFESDARRYGYAYQAAFYRSLLASERGCDPLNLEVFFIAVETSEPFRTGVWHVGKGVIAEAEKQNRWTIQDIQECIRTNKWRSHYAETRVFDWI